MVLRVCRGILGNEHDAMDAFQATFLVLVRRGRALWVRDSLGPWLHRVACRAARRAAVSERRRADRLQDLLVARPTEILETSANDEVALLHEELDRLPERYRVPIVLCDLEGWTCEKAAQHLGRPVGTVKSWRARGREKLRERLSRRGVTGRFQLPVPALHLLADATVREMARMATQYEGAGGISVEVLTLVKGTLMSLLVSKLKTILWGVLPIALLVGSAGAWAFQQPAHEKGVSTIEEPETSRGSSELFTRVYYVGDLLSARGSSAPVGENALEKPKFDANPLVTLLTRFVARGRWETRDPQGNVLNETGVTSSRPGSITVFHLSQSLIVRQTPEVHEEVATFLHMLRDFHFKSDATSGAGATPPVTLPSPASGRLPRMRHYMKQLENEIQALEREKAATKND